jgi:hypothetical protein
MKTTIFTLSLAILFTAPALSLAAGPPGTQGKDEGKQQEQTKQGEVTSQGPGSVTDDDLAKKLSVNLPQTLVVKQDPAGKLSVFHSPANLKAGASIESVAYFSDDFDTRETNVNVMDLTRTHFRTGAWGFYWNHPDGLPTYTYYNPYYNFRYDYVYRVYDEYTDEYGFKYTYYGWKL